MKICEVTIGIRIPKNMLNEFYISNDDFVEKQYKGEILIFHNHLKNKKNSGKQMKTSEIFLLNLQNSLEGAVFNQKSEDETSIFGDILCIFEFDESDEKNLSQYIETMFYHKPKDAYDCRVEKINPDIVKKIRQQMQITEDEKEDMIAKLDRMTLPLSETLEFVKDNITHKIRKK